MYLKYLYLHIYLQYKFRSSKKKKQVTLKYQLENNVCASSAFVEIYLLGTGQDITHQNYQ